MLIKDYASLEAVIDKGESSRLLIEIALRPASLAGAGPAYDPGEVHRAIRDGFREALTQVELERLARTTKPPKSRARRWFGRAFTFMLCAAIGSVATLLLSASHTTPQYGVVNVTAVRRTRRAHALFQMTIYAARARHSANAAERLCL